jgi:DNA-binding transcriptional LysR family regulator
MTRLMPTISTDQVLAFVELTRTGSFRLAASALHLSEEGVRSRLLMLEQRLGVSLYEKQRGRRAAISLTQAGQTFSTKAAQFIEDAQELTNLFDPGRSRQEIHVAASQFLSQYLLIDIVRAYHECSAGSMINIITRTEQQILAAMEEDAKLALGICAPIEYPTGFVFHHWFSMSWHFIAATGHPLLQRTNLTLNDLVDEPLILFEPGSTGRQHILEAFHQRDLTPRIVMEATSTQLIVRMVEAHLGVAIVPLLASGIVTKDINIGQISLGDQIRSIDSGLMYRRDSQRDSEVQKFANFVTSYPL